jgi:hypothetical protein
MTIQKILVSGNYVFIPFGQAGIKIIDISDPTNPVLAKTYPTIGYAESIFLAQQGSKTYAYISDYQFTEGSFMGLEVADFTDLNSPVFVASKQFAFIGYSYVKGNNAFVVDGDGFTVLDVSALPSLPVVAVYHDYPQDIYYDITVKGNIAYVSYFLTQQAVGFDTVDISNPAHPAYKDFFEWTDPSFGVPTVFLDPVASIAYLVGADIPMVDISNPGNVVYRGDWIDMFFGANNVTKSGNNFFIAEEAGIEIYNLTFSAVPPVRLVTFDYLGGDYTPDYITDIALQDRTGDLGKKFEYVATFTTGLKVVEVTDASSPVVRYEQEWGHMDTVLTVMLSGNYLYTTGFDTMIIFDVSNPLSPQKLGTYPLDRVRGFAPWFDDGLAVSGNYLFVCQYGTFNTLDVVDVTNKSNPVLVNSYPAGIMPMSVFIDGNYGYIGEGDGLEIVNVSDVNNITQVAKFTDDHVSQVQVAGNTAYYTNFTSLVTMNVADKAHPAVLGSYVLPSQSDEQFFLPFRFFKDGNFVYVPTMLDEIFKLDVSNPSNITKATDIPTPGMPVYLQVENGTFFIADYYSLLTIK